MSRTAGNLTYQDDLVASSDDEFHPMSKDNVMGRPADIPILDETSYPDVEAKSSIPNHAPLNNSHTIGPGNDRKRKLSISWDSTLDNLLKAAIDQLGTSNWSNVSEFLNENISNQYSDFISPADCQLRYNQIYEHQVYSQLLNSTQTPVETNPQPPQQSTLSHPSIPPPQSSQSVQSASYQTPSSKKNRVFPPWTQDEKDKLVRMVDQAKQGDETKFNKQITVGDNKLKTISWTNIANELKREVDDVNHQYNQIRMSKFRRGAFTPEEDRIIIQRYHEWHNQPTEKKPKTGLWVALEKELNREDKRISERYRSILSKRVVFNSADGSFSLTHAPPTITSSSSSSNNYSPPPIPPNNNNGSSSSINILNHTSLNPSSINIQMISSANHLPPHHSLSIPPNSQAIMLDPSTLDLLHMQQQQTSPFLTHHGVLSSIPLIHQSQAMAQQHYMNQNLNSLSDASLPLMMDDDINNPNSQFRMEKGESVRWNDSMDNLLVEGMRLFNADWRRIADHVNQNSCQGSPIVDDTKCRGRWYRQFRKPNQT